MVTDMLLTGPQISLAGRHRALRRCRRPGVALWETRRLVHQLRHVAHLPIYCPPDWSYRTVPRLASWQSLEGVIAASQDNGCDLFSWLHGRHGLIKQMFGGQANKVIVLSSVPVLIESGLAKVAENTWSSMRRASPICWTISPHGI
jgi:hypothetical protein